METKSLSLRVLSLQSKESNALILVLILPFLLIRFAKKVSDTIPFVTPRKPLNKIVKTWLPEQIQPFLQSNSSGYFI